VTVTNLGRVLVAALLVLTAMVPAAALAQEASDEPLSDVPSTYEPALRAAAEGLGLSYDELTAASEEELQSVLCAKFDELSTEDIVAQARAALAEASDGALAGLSDDERTQLEANLPTIIGQVESEYCAAGGSSSGDARAEERTTGDIPVPNRVDTGGGGAGGAGAVPMAFGLLFATLFGLVGIGVTGRRSAT
jgi:hypothetical protein